MSTPTAEAARPLYELEEVQRTYQRGSTPVLALSDITTRIESGSVTAIVGPSGSGKTTLLQLLGALDTPTAGRISFDGTDLTEASDRTLTDIRAKHIGFVFQQFNLIPTLTAAENVAVAVSHGSRAVRRARAQELLSEIGLAERADHLPSRLSGGEQQRVAIARALANRPRVVLADEPTGNLDQATSADVMRVLTGLADAGVTVIVITHDEGVASHATRRIGLSDGRVVADSAIPSGAAAETRQGP